MPFSSNSGKAFIDRAVSCLKPLIGKNVLDVGAGSGTYSDRYRKILTDGKWTAVEAWEPYVEKYGLKEKYDQVIVGEAQHKVPLLDDRYGIAFFGDVVEHLLLEDARVLINETLDQIADIVIVSIPIGKYPQDEWEGNHYEKHLKDDWSVEEFYAIFGEENIAFHAVENEIGVFVLSWKIPKEIIRSMMKVKVGVYAICKNEERDVDRFCSTIPEWIDDIVVVDTGSTDSTLERFAKYPKVRVVSAVVQPWHFGDAKNIALSLLKSDLDIAVSIDMDEFLPNESWNNLYIGLTNYVVNNGVFPDRVHHSFTSVFDWEKIEALRLPVVESREVAQHLHDRIHSRHGWLWALCVHEILEWKDLTREARVITLENVGMIQYSRAKAGRSSYLELLEVSVKERPDVWKSWVFLAQEYQKIDNRDQALWAYTEAMKVEDSDKGFIALSRAYVYYNESDKIKDLVLAAEIDKDVRETQLTVYSELQNIDPKKAMKYLEQGLSIKEPKMGYKYRKEMWEAKKVAQLEGTLKSMKDYFYRK